MKYEDATKQGEDLKIERLDMANGGTATITVSTDWIGTVCAAIEKQIPKKARQPNPLTADVVYKFDEDLLGKLLRTGKTYDCTLCYYGWNYAYDISSDSYMYSKSDKAC